MTRDARVRKMLEEARDSEDVGVYISDLFNTGAFLAGVVGAIGGLDKEGSRAAMLRDVNEAFDRGWEEIDG